MAIQSITYRKGFQIRLTWPKGVQGMILYARPRGAGPLSEDELLDLCTEPAALERMSGFHYRAGISTIQYSPNDPRLKARWIDIWYMDYGAAGEVIAHRMAGSFFNGDCVVGVQIEYMRVSDAYTAVHITVQNMSGFEIEAGGIGYRVGGRCFAIPLDLKQGQRIELPQFEIPVDSAVEMHRFEDKYPARFSPLMN